MFSLPRFFRLLALGASVFAVVLSLSTAAFGQSLGRASADFPNARANKIETPFGRLVADALQNAAGSDCALINAGALRNGTLEAGDIERADIEPLLSFGEDDVVKLSLAGAQLRAALERAASIYPTGSPAFLHCAGLNALFDPNAPNGVRLKDVKINGKNLDDQVVYSVAMPVSLAEGAAGYFNIWNGARSVPSGVTLLVAIERLIAQKGKVTPEANARFGPR